MTTAMRGAWWCAALAAAAVLSRCGSRAVGDWESAEAVGNGERDEMTLEADGQGEATLYYIVEIGGDLYLGKSEFDLTWEDKGGGDLEIELECTDSDLYDGGCGADDFTMECEIKADGDEMECEGDESWRDYEFEWEAAELSARPHPSRRATSKT